MVDPPPMQGGIITEQCVPEFADAGTSTSPISKKEALLGQQAKRQQRFISEGAPDPTSSTGMSPSSPIITSGPWGQLLNTMPRSSVGPRGMDHSRAACFQKQPLAYSPASSFSVVSGILGLVAATAWPGGSMDMPRPPASGLHVNVVEELSIDEGVCTNSPAQRITARPMLDIVRSVVARDIFSGLYHPNIVSPRPGRGGQQSPNASPSQPVVLDP